MTPLPDDVWLQAAAQGAMIYSVPQAGSYIVLQQDDMTRVYVNRCPHRHLPLGRSGRVTFTADRRLLVCANHGAKFDPVSGQCVAGPCRGKALQRLPELERLSQAPEP